MCYFHHPFNQIRLNLHGLMGKSILLSVSFSLSSLVVERKPIVNSVKTVFAFELSILSFG